MKKLIIIILALVPCININAQNTVGKADDMGRIALAAYVPQQIDKMPDAARSMLSNKLSQIVTQNGMGGSGLNQRFIITANITVLTKDLTPTAPPMTALTLEVTLYIGDGIEGTKFSSKSIEIKGVGTNETKAYIEAIKGIKPSDPSLKSFIEEGKTKIVEYYNSKCDFIIKEAQTLASQNKFEEAIFKLTGVPEVCKGCYDKCMDAIIVIYKAKMERECQTNIAKAQTFKAQEKFDEAAEALSTILPDLTCYAVAKALMIEINDHRCSVALGKAKGAWASKDIDATSNALKDIPADSKCYKDALTLTNEVRAWVKEKDKRDWNFKLQEQKDDVDIKKANINAARDIGVAYGKGQPKTVTYNVRGWW